jgi:hypothetical protein
MTIDVARVEEQIQVKRYRVQHPISDYTFPQEARIHHVRFDAECMHVELTDGRRLSLPLWWIPTLNNAEPKEREKFRLNRERTMIIWDPDDCAINDEIAVIDYLGPCRKET